MEYFAQKERLFDQAIRMELHICNIFANADSIHPISMFSFTKPRHYE